MSCEVEYTDEFRAWWDGLQKPEQKAITHVLLLLERAGPQLGFPYSSAIRGSRYGHLRELRVQHGGRPYRVLYAFDPRRAAVLLFGGDKSGDQRWYTRAIRMAEEIYSKHLRHLMAAGPAKP